MRSIKNDYNFISGLKKTSLGPLQFIGGLIAGAAVGGRTTTTSNVMTEGVCNFFWHGPKEMVLSLTRHSRPQP